MNPQWIVAYGYRNSHPRIVRWHDHSEIARVTSETDARLIASAPDLLAALKEIIKAHDINMGKSAVQLRIDLAREAITKAEA